MELQEFKDTINQVATILKMEVEFPPDEDMQWHRWAYLKKDYRSIRILNGDEHKLHISGDFPKSIKGEPSRYGSAIDINISASKTSEQMARDIERRLLPIYLPELEKAVNQVNQINRYHQKREANIQKMAEYFGVEFKEDKEPSIYVYKEIKGLGPRIVAQGEDAIKFELELTPEMAIKVFDLLKQELIP